MKWIARLSLMLLPTASWATPAVNGAEIMVFNLDRWNFVCEVQEEGLRFCGTQTNFGAIWVRLEERINQRIAVTLRGGCAASGNETEDILDETLSDESVPVIARLAASRIVARVNERRGACGETPISRQEQFSVNNASTLFAQVAR